MRPAALIPTAAAGQAGARGRGSPRCPGLPAAAAPATRAGGGADSATPAPPAPVGSRAARDCFPRPYLSPKLIFCLNLVAGTKVTGKSFVTIGAVRGAGDEASAALVARAGPSGRGWLRSRPKGSSLLGDPDSARPGAGGARARGACCAPRDVRAARLRLTNACRQKNKSRLVCFSWLRPFPFPRVAPHQRPF